MNKGSIILLNGVSSSGKTTLAKALIKSLPDYFHYSLDDFDIVIEHMEDREHDRLIPVETEYFFHRSIAMFADRGINLIVDHVLHYHFTSEDFAVSLFGYSVLRVGVHCPADELERREAARGDRRIGQARDQLEFVHKEEVYDLEVDTFIDGLESCCTHILRTVKGDRYAEINL
ncbi:chloramphenicol phosphotransferase CPT family protein [Paenibacillus sp. S150]|uniref:chloramphenicol phosphotransferase CPT family protein n=1 Tax=Paenibacillus sp. S150 TaxID=2749826 RepID=UPI001C55ABC0|nr:AAA family ATPase [Paenibacillus sp. S150]MBW4083112.1 AAA family ATPase [Paenibacillus sp. S150]